MTQTISAQTHWYKQFWPWFLILLPASAVIASIITIILAVNNADSLVVDDYYKKALQINRDLSKIEYAKKIGLTATLNVAGDRLALTISLKDKTIQFAPVLQLMLVHPADSNKDFEVNLIHNDSINNVNSAERTVEYSTVNHVSTNLIKRVDNGAWYVRLISPDKQWQLNGKLNKNKKTISLYAD